MQEPDIQRYLDSIGSHNVKPRFMATLQAILEKIDAGTMVAKDIPLEFYVQSAKGQQLDLLGQIVGADRRFPPVTVPGYPETLPDDLFRMVILAKIVQNQWDGTGDGFREIWESTLDSIMDATYYDNQDMTMDAAIEGELEPLMVEMILHGYILPKPMGVRMNVGVTSKTKEKSTWAQCLATLDYLRCKAGIDYMSDKNTSDGAFADTVCAAAYGYALAPIPRSNEQPDPITGYSGAVGIANYARITISTI